MSAWAFSSEGKNAPSSFIGNIALWLFIAFCISGGIGCDEDQPPPAIFPGTSLIELSTPADGEVTGPNPHFQWLPTNAKRVYLGIFSERIAVSNGGIANGQSNFWGWFNGIGRGKEGDVYFDEGTTVIDGQLFLDSVLLPLESGTTYYWAVWAWDEEGGHIVLSSTEYMFTVQ